MRFYVGEPRSAPPPAELAGLDVPDSFRPVTEDCEFFRCYRTTRLAHPKRILARILASTGAQSPAEQLRRDLTVDDVEPNSCGLTPSGGDYCTYIGHSQGEQVVIFYAPYQDLHRQKYAGYAVNVFWSASTALH